MHVVEDMHADPTFDAAVRSIEHPEREARIHSITEVIETDAQYRERRRQKIAAEARDWDAADEYLSDALCLEDQARGTAGAEYDEAFDGFADYALYCGRLDPDSNSFEPVTGERVRDKRDPVPDRKRTPSAFRIPQPLLDDGESEDLPEWAIKSHFHDPRAALRHGLGREWNTGGDPVTVLSLNGAEQHPNLRAVCLNASDVRHDEPEPDRFSSVVPLATELQFAAVPDGYVFALAGEMALGHRVLRGYLEFGPEPRPPARTHLVRGRRMRERIAGSPLVPDDAPIMWPIPRQRDDRFFWRHVRQIAAATPSREAARSGELWNAPHRLALQVGRHDHRGMAVLMNHQRSGQHDPDGTSVHPTEGLRWTFHPQWKINATASRTKRLQVKARRRRAMPRRSVRKRTIRPSSAVVRQRTRDRIQLAVRRGELDRWERGRYGRAYWTGRSLGHRWTDSTDVLEARITLDLPV